MIFKRTRRIISNNVYILKLLHKACRSKVLCNILMTIFGSLIQVVTMVFFYRTYINEIEAGKSFSEVAVFIVAMFLFEIVSQFAIKCYDSFYMPRANAEIGRKMTTWFFKKSTEIDLACIESPEYFEMYVRANMSLADRANEVLHTLCDGIASIFTLSTMSYILFDIDPFLIVFALVPFIYMLTLQNGYNRMNYKFSMEDAHINREKDYTERTFYLADYAKELRLSNMHDVMNRRYGKIMARFRHLSVTRFPKKLLYALMGYFVFGITVNEGTLLYSAYRTVVSKTMTVGDFFIATGAIQKVSTALNTFAGVFTRFADHSNYIENLRTFFEYEPKVSLNEDGPQAPKKNVGLRLENVSFKYPSSENYVLKNINIEIKPGQKIAVVGNNGAGKSTLVKLLMRLYDVDEGSVFMNGTDIRKINLNSYHAAFGALFQDYAVVALSVVENVLMKKDITQKDLEIAEKALKDSGAYKKVMSLEHGMDTVLSREFDENGTVLSGGEYQKIALARVFAKDAGVVILDEPSSALDPIAEYDMYNNMMETCKDKTVIFISHRLASAVMTKVSGLM